MHIRELAVYLEREIEYPVERSTVIAELGTIPVDGPIEPTDDVGTVLGRLDEETYGSADELFLTILGTVSDRYIGRKYYDDRGTNPGPPIPAERLREHESF